MGTLRCGQGAGEGQGAAAFANLQARADLMAAVNSAKSSDVPPELIEAAEVVLFSPSPKIACATVGADVTQEESIWRPKKAFT